MPFSAILSSILLMLSRRKALIGVVFLGLALVTSLYLAFTPPRYVARSTVLAKFGREYALKSDAGGSPMMPSNFGQEDIVSSVTEVMRIESLAAEVIRRVGAQRLYPSLNGGDLPLNKAAELRFASDLAIKPALHSNVIRLELANSNPQVAAAALNAYVDAFENKFLSLYGEDRLKVYERDLAEARRSLDAVVQVATKLSQESGTYADGGQFERLVAQRDQLQRSNDRIVACCADTAAAHDVARQLAEANQHVARQNANLARLREVGRQRDIAQEAVDTAQRRVQEARNAQNMDDSRMTSVQVVEPATPPLRTAPPRKTLKLLFGLILSAVAALGIGLLCEVTRRRFSTAAELRSVFPHVPVLAEVPYAK